MENLTNIYYVGHIGAQHLLSSCLVMIRVIKNTKFIKESKVLKGTNTERKIKSLYRLNYDGINHLYEEIANEHFNRCTRIVENMACEFFRDIKDPLNKWDENTYIKSIENRCKGKVRFPDSFFSSQGLFLEENGLIIEYRYSSSGNVQKNKLRMFHCREDPNRTWYHHQSETNMNQFYIKTGCINRKKKINAKIVTICFSAGQVKPLYTNNRESMEIVEDSSIIESVSLLSSSDDEIIEYISKENIGLKLSELQQEILSMCDNHHTFFAIDNNWYRGVMAHFDFNEIVKDIL